MKLVTANWCSWQVPPSVRASQAWLTGVQGTGAVSQGSVRASGQGVQGLDVFEDEGGAAQGLLVTGVLEFTAVKRDTKCTKLSWNHYKKFYDRKSWCSRSTLCVCDEPPTYRIPRVRAGITGGLGGVPRIIRMRWGLRWGAKYIHQVQHGWLQREQGTEILRFEFFWIGLWNVKKHWRRILGMFP